MKEKTYGDREPPFIYKIIVETEKLLQINQEDNGLKIKGKFFEWKNIKTKLLYQLLTEDKEKQANTMKYWSKELLVDKEEIDKYLRLAES
uniref:Uncharacterized protein n=1 Tax=Romanomermis culicivorax TaxID=13658 RepID=A0A915KT69_ROMCU